MTPFQFKTWPTIPTLASFVNMRAELSYILGAFLDCLLKELTTVYLHTTLEFEMFLFVFTVKNVWKNEVYT